MNIVFFDDEDFDKDISNYETELRKEPGWNVFFTTNPEVALEEIVAGRCDVLISDVLATKIIGGREVDKAGIWLVRKIKSLANLKKFPIMMLTNLDVVAVHSEMEDLFGTDENSRKFRVVPKKTLDDPTAPKGKGNNELQAVPPNMIVNFIHRLLQE